MSYFAPMIDETGLHMPTYTDIRDQLILEAKDIFGSDIYLEPDSQDYQFISSVAEKIYDSYQLAQMVYNNKSPITATGISLDSIVKLNGIERKVGTFSTCLVTLAGTAGTVITNGVISDVNGNQWNLPATVTLDGTGAATVTATSATIGSNTANIGELTQIVTPTFGWDTVTNIVSAVVGTDTETDSELRARQARSTAVRSSTMLGGVRAAILAVDGVTRMRVYENDTDSTDADGLPEHSITAIAEGGTDTDVATAIYEYKGIGAYTNGDVEVDIIDEYSQTSTIRFFRPTYQDIEVEITVKALSGYTTDITDQIKDNIVEYLNSLAIGEDLSISSLWGIALTAMPDLKSPLFSITSVLADVVGGTPGTSDIVIAYNEVTQGTLTNITVTVV